jgi:hypothetical protein
MLVNIRNVAGLEPPVGREGVGLEVRPVPVAGEHIGALDEQLSMLFT